MRKRVAFLLRGAARVARGGYKVLFTYANFLARSGYEVTVVFPALNGLNARGLERPLRLARYCAGVVVPSIYRPDGWFPLDPDVRTRWIARIRPEHATEFDLGVISDHVVAADLRGGEPGPRRSNRSRAAVYVLQEYEYYMAGGAAARTGIERAIRTADCVVAISPVAEQLALRFAEPERVRLIANGVELDQFSVRIPRAGARAERQLIGFAFREEAFKRTADIVAALDTLRTRGRLQGYSCWAYGSRRVSSLPPWIEYHCRPSSARLCELLNRSAIFVVASLYEGWGLPGAEAMACGAALVTSRNGGCEAYAHHEQNALLVSPGDVPELAAAVGRLIDDPALRERLAAEGRRSVQQFGWGRACEEFLEVVRRLL